MKEREQLAWCLVRNFLSLILVAGVWIYGIPDSEPNGISFGRILLIAIAAVNLTGVIAFIQDDNE
jgi:hypothetical protein